MSEETRIRVKVDILGKEYRFISSSEAPVEYIHHIAGYVDSQMRKITNHQPSLDMPRVAVLAAVNIADEYFKIKKEVERGHTRVEDRIAELESRLREHERIVAQANNEKRELQAQLEKQRMKEQELLDELVTMKEQSAAMSRAAQQESGLKEAYEKLQDEYRKLQTEFNDWLDMVDHDRAGH